jgi:glycosyltransferase involved in cell wall biosynthesis
MKIAVMHVTGTFALGGSETNAWGLARYLHDAGHEVHFYGGATANPIWRYPEVELRTAPFVHRDRVSRLSARNQKLVERFTFARNLHGTIAAEGYDILNIHKPYDIPFAVWMRRRSGCKVVWRCHGPGLYPGTKHFIHRTDAIYCVSKYTRSLLHEHFDVPADVIYSGVDTGFYTPEAPNDVAAESPRILFFGRMVRFKGLPALVRALGLIRELSWTAELVGDGPAQAEAKALAKELGIEARVSFPGSASTREQVRAAIERANIVVFPSTRKETFSNATLEAMSMARAVVASDAGGFPEAVTSDHDGLLAKAGDPEAIAAAISRYLEDRSLMGKVSANARATALERFDSQYSYGCVEALMRRVAG